MTEPAFTFDGKDIALRRGQSVAAALTEAGVRVFRRTAGNAGRGMFCGIGVCQDCLVTIDGVPNMRACMTAAASGQKVETQVAFAPLHAAKAPKAGRPARVIEPDVLVVGGGAGGLSAAIAARRAGASVIVLDERKVPGGQFFKQSADGRPLDDQQARGRALLAEARDSGAEMLGSVEVWGAFDGPLFLAEHEGGALIARPGTAVIATGAYERPRMAPGWTLPGVMTTGAAQTLWRSYRTLPGRRVALCGSGPLNLQVALELAKGGAEIALVAETAPAPWTRPWPAFRAGLADPKLMLAGAAMVLGLRRHGVAVRNRTDLVGVESADGGLVATFRSATGAESAHAVDALCMNDGFEPQNEILRLLGARMDYDSAVGHLRCARDASLETSVPGLFAVGDCAGLGGAPAAMIEGRIAGAAAAARAGHGAAAPRSADLRALGRQRAFQSWLWRLHSAAPRSLDGTPAETVICRCEELTLGRIAEGLARKPGHIGALKRATRAGMGRCQGRYCGPAVARMVAEATGRKLEDNSYFAPRVPIKPVGIAAILAAQEALDDTP